MNKLRFEEKKKKKTLREKYMDFDALTILALSKFEDLLLFSVTAWF